MFVNQSTDAPEEMKATQWFALNTAEYLAFECDRDVLLVMYDLEAYRSELRQEPGYTKENNKLGRFFSRIHERAGVSRSGKGSLTMIPIIRLASYSAITATVRLSSDSTAIPTVFEHVDGMIRLTEKKQIDSIYPPIELNQSFNHNMYKISLRKDHTHIVQQVNTILSFVQYVNLCIQSEVMADEEQDLYLKFRAEFERTIINQGSDELTYVPITLDKIWKLLDLFPKIVLSSLPQNIIREYGYKSPKRVLSLFTSKSLLVQEKTSDLTIYYS